MAMENGDQASYDEIMRLKFQTHWLRGRIAATAARFNWQAVCDWERKVTAKLDRIAQSDGHLLAESALHSFPSEAVVFDNDYGYGDQNGMDRDVCDTVMDEGRDLPDGDEEEEDCNDNAT